MKKLLYLFLTVLIVACSGEDGGSNNDDNNDDNNEPNLLVSSINYTRLYGSGTQVTEETFTYDGNKIIEVTTQSEVDGNPVGYNSGQTQFIYANNKISRVNYYDNDTNLTRQMELLYDSQGRLVSQEICDILNNDACDEFIIVSYSYNDDGSIIVTEANQEPVIYQFDNNGNIISVTESEATLELIYDNQKNPFKNITGASNILGGISTFYTDSRVISFNNNCLSFTDISSSGNVYTQNWTYDYNDAGYPRNVFFEDDYDDNQTIVIEYFE